MAAAADDIRALEKLTEEGSDLDVSDYDGRESRSVETASTIHILPAPPYSHFLHPAHTSPSACDMLVNTSPASHPQRTQVQLSTWLPLKAMSTLCVGCSTAALSLDHTTGLAAKLKSPDASQKAVWEVLVSSTAWHLAG